MPHVLGNFQILRSTRHNHRDRSFFDLECAPRLQPHIHIDAEHLLVRPVPQTTMSRRHLQRVSTAPLRTFPRHPPGSRRQSSLRQRWELHGGTQAIEDRELRYTSINHITAYRAQADRFRGQRPRSRSRLSPKTTNRTGPPRSAGTDTQACKHAAPSVHHQANAQRTLLNELGSMRVSKNGSRFCCCGGLPGPSDSVTVGASAMRCSRWRFSLSWRFSPLLLSSVAYHLPEACALWRQCLPTSSFTQAPRTFFLSFLSGRTSCPRSSR